MGMYPRASSIIGYFKINLAVQQAVWLHGVVMLFAVKAMTASAQIVVDPNALGYQPGVEMTNFVPTVNIVAPQSGGVSHNKYTRLNVGAEGVIYNNACAGSTTQLAGEIKGNANLCAGGAAATILNEITGSGGTILAGQTEVAGKSANVIYANNDGITCDGCGFINTNEATLTTGTPTVGGSNVTFSTNVGEVKITRSGLDGSGASGGVNIVAKQVSVDGIVKTSGSVLVVGGSSSVDLATKIVSGGGANNNSYAVDSSVFGGFQSGSIKIIGNDTGLGVRQLGSIHSINNDVTLESSGDLTVGQITANADVDNFNSKKTASVHLKASKKLEILGDVFSSKRVTLEAEDITISNFVDIDSLEEVTITAQNDLISGAQIQSLKAISLTAGKDLSIGAVGQANSVLQANATINIKAENVTIAEATLWAEGDVTVDAQKKITSNNVLYHSKNALSLSADTIDTYRHFRLKSNGMPVLNMVNLDLGSALDWDAVQINGLQTLDVKGGGVLVGKNLTINNLQHITNAGIIYSDGDMALNVGNFTNSGGGTLIAEDRSNATTNPSITLTIGQVLTNDGQIIADKNIIMNSNRYGGNGLLSAGDLVQYSGGDFSQTAGGSFATQIIAKRLDIDSTGNIALAGKSLIKGTVELDAAASLTFSGVFNAEASTIKAASLDLLSSAVVSVTTMGAKVQGAIENAGYLFATRLVDLAAGSYRGTGYLISDKDLVYDGGNFDLVSGGQAIGESLTLTSSGDVTLAGETSIKGNATIKASSGAFDLSNQFGAIDIAVTAASAVIGAAGKLSANDKLVLNSQTGKITNDGILNGTTLLDLDGGSYSGAGQIVSSTLVDIDTTGEFQQAAAGQIVAPSIALKAGGVIHLAGIVSGSTKTDISSSALVTLTGKIVGGDVDVAGVGVTLSGTGSIGGTTVDIATGQSAVNNAGKIYGIRSVDLVGQDYSGDGAIGTGAGGRFSFRGENFTQGSNGLLIADVINVTASGSLTLAGQTQATQTATFAITGGADVSGRLQSGASLTLEAAALTLVVSSAEIFSKDTQLKIHGAIDNRASIYGSSSLNISGTGVSYMGSGLLSAGTLTYNGGLFTQSTGGRLKAGILDMTVGGDLTLDGSTQVTTASDLKLGSNKFDLNGKASLGVLDLDAALLDIATGSVLFSTNADIDLTGNFTNDGVLIGRDALDIAGAVILNSGMLKTRGNLALSGSAFTQNSTGISQGDVVNLSTTNAATIDGTLQATKGMVLKVGTDAVIEGTLIAGALDLDSASLSVGSAGRFSSSSADINVVGAISNSGSIFSDTQLDLRSARYSGAGILFTNGAFTFSGGDFSLHSGAQLIANSLAMTSTGDVSMSGLALSKGMLTITTTGDVTISGQTLGSGITMSANALTVDPSAMLCAGSVTLANYRCDGQITLNVTGTLANNGLMTGGSGLALTAGSYSGAGNLVTNGSLSYSGGGFSALAGAEMTANSVSIVAVSGDIRLAGNAVASANFVGTSRLGNLFVDGNIAAQSISLDAATSIQQGAASTIGSTSSVTNNSIRYVSPGKIILAGNSSSQNIVIDMNLATVPQSVDISGRVQANTVSITGGGLRTIAFSQINPKTGNAEKVPNIIAGTLILNLNNGDINNNGGILVTNGSINLVTSGVYSGSGDLYASNDINVQAQSFNQQSGARLVAVNLILEATSVITLSGVNNVSANMTIKAGNLLTIDGALRSVSTSIDSDGLLVRSFSQPSAGGGSSQVANIYTDTLTFNVNNSAVTNSGIIFSNNGFSLTASGGYTGAGSLVTNGDFTFNGTDFDAPTGTVAAVNFINNATGLKNIGSSVQPISVAAPITVKLTDVFQGQAQTLSGLVAPSTGVLATNPVLQSAVQVTPAPIDVTDPNPVVSDARTPLSLVVDPSPITVTPSPINTNIAIKKQSKSAFVSSVVDQSTQDKAVTDALALVADPIGKVVVGGDTDPVSYDQIKDKLGEGFVLPEVSVRLSALLPQTSIQHKPPVPAFELRPNATAVLIDFELSNGVSLNWRRAMGAIVRPGRLGLETGADSVQLGDAIVRSFGMN